MGTMHHLGLAMLIGLIENSRRTVGFLNTKHLVRNNVESFVPADALKLANTAILGISAPGASGPGGSARIKVHPLKRIEDARRRVNALLVGQANRRNKGLVARRKGFSAGMHNPRLYLIAAVLLVVANRPNAQNLAVLDVYHTGIRARAGAAPAYVPHQGSYAVGVLRLPAAHRWSSFFRLPPP